jgi:hypothetical protein
MNRLVSPILLVLFLASFSIGWRSTPDDRVFLWATSMTLDGSRLYVSDSDTGLHVYDVSNLSAPSKVIRIPVRGNVSSALKDGIVFTNDYNQLQAIRITDGSYDVVAKIGEPYSDPHGFPWHEGGGRDSGYGCMCSDNSFDPMTSPTPTGGGGSSFATFAVVDNELYRVNDDDLIVYDVTDAEKPAKVSSVHVDWNIETLYPTPNLLFIGGRLGMYIFDRGDPLHPKQLSKIEHTVACDPVVVEGTTAFVTLRQMGGCGGVTNELMCVNIEDPSAPVIIGEKPLTTPWGLAVQNQQLFLSHGDSGYSLLDVSQPDAPEVKANWPTLPTRDFIWSGNTLFVLSKDNVYIYDVANPLVPVFLSQVQGVPVK